ncbi:MAG TPA: ABC transporter substrate-binding protein [Rectinemataceae bacterium]|nr:ABC transporter substrate-binding protein [Rectinemataceae bacterium]
MRRLIAISVALVFCLGAAFAAPKVDISLAYPVAVDAPITAMLKAWTQDYMASHPDVKVTLIFSGGYPDVKTAVETAIQGGAKAPTLAVMLATDVYDLVNAKYVDSLDDLAARAPGGEAFVKDFLPAYMGNSRYKGKLWSLPFQRSAVVLYYNADLLRSKGLKPPRDWEELGKDAEALTVDGGATRWGIEIPTENPYWTFQPLAIGAGKNVYTDDVTVNFDAPEVVDAVQFYNDLSQKYKGTPPGVQSSWGTSTQNFAAGKTAMIIHTTGSLAGILKTARFKVGVMAVPGRAPGSLASVTGGGNLYLTAGHSQAEREAAFAFAQYLLAPSRVAEFSRATGYIPNRKAALASPAFKAWLKEVPQAADAVKALDYAGPELATQDLDAVKTIFNNYLQAAFNGSMTPQAAMDAAQKESDKALADYR